MNGEKKGYPGSSIPCNDCSHDARFVNWRSRVIVSLFGPIRLLLSYYHCSRCGTGQKPWDHVLGLTTKSLTPAAAQVTAQAGVLASFAEASQRTLRTMCGLKLSESTIERTTEEAGQQVAERLASGNPQGPRQSWAWQRDAQDQTCAYVSLDHTGVRQQGPQGCRADGKMAGVGIVYNPRSEHDERTPLSRQVRYLSGFYELDELGRQLRREAEAVGIMDADIQIALSDGGSGLEDVLKRFFPRCICILDFWHAKEHLVELAQALYPTDDEARTTWQDQWCHRLKHEGGRVVLEQLQAMDVTEHSVQVRECHRKQVTYFRNHAHRMDYPTYVARGWQIGSGPVESACKTVVGNRLKGGGMRWGERGADAVCHLRAVYLSEPSCWNSLWYGQAT
ncbi:MAG: ISKra4 family transposase [Planctomycetes bacterium]|jgi:hypothetical protein|nr:ISKra4 family transposase [Planctomycetota bacterium]